MLQFASAKLGYFSLIDFYKILLDDSHLSDNGIYCSIINMGDVNSYWAAFRYSLGGGTTANNNKKSSVIKIFKSIWNNENYVNLIWKSHYINLTTYAKKIWSFIQGSCDEMLSQLTVTSVPSWQQNFRRNLTCKEEKIFYIFILLKQVKYNTISTIQ